MKSRIRVGISACLLGEKLRYDGGHKLNHYLKESLGACVEWVPVCPEVSAGLPVPREPMRLVGGAGSLRIVTISTGIDATDTIQAWSDKWLTAQQTTGLRGFVFKSGSPSCGIKDIDVLTPSGQTNREGVGIFSAAFMRRFPLIAVEDNESLQDTKVRKKFIERLGCLGLAVQ